MQRNESPSKPSRRRRLAVAAAGLVAVGAAGLSTTVITNAHAAEFFSPVIFPTAEDPTVAGNGVSPDFNKAQELAINGLTGLCQGAGYVGLAPGTRTGQSNTPEGEIVYQAFGQCLR